ncbi:glycosyltransferase, partial [archaeon]|nr:glycosyltransferase [archaeon]
FAQYNRKKEDAFRLFGSFVTRKIASWLVDFPSDLEISSFFVMQKFLVDEICKYTGPYSFIFGLVFRSTQNYGVVKLNHYSRKHGTSGYSLTKLFSLFLNGFTSFSVKPLRILTFCGSLLSFFSFLLLFGILFDYFFLSRPDVLGWTSIIIAILFLGGIELMSIGVVGEYIGRIFLSQNKQPQAVIRRKYGY